MVDDIKMSEDAVDMSQSTGHHMFSITASPSLDSCSNMISDPSTTIPNEIWVKILSHLNQKQLVRSRLVCSTWRNVVDEHFNFSIIVHDDKTNLKRLLELKIKDCLITKLNYDVDILLHPEILKRVRFWGSIHPKSMHKILSNATNLEELSMTRYPLTQKNILTSDRVLDLQKLIKLEILGYCCKDVSEEVSTNVVRLISQNMPSISKLFINVTCYWKYMDAIIIAFFEFLARHRKQISYINASLVPAANGHEMISLLPTHIPQMTKNALYDEHLQLESLRLSIASKYIPFWTPIIQNQTKLVDLRVNWISSSEQSQLSGISITNLYPAIIQSASTLVHVDLRELNLSIDDARNAIPLDANIFRFAVNLRRLVLVRNKEDCQRNLEPYGSPTIVNINNILPELTDLEIVRFKCLTSELEMLVASSQNLKSVKLQHNGSAAGQGVHGGLVESLTMKPKIKVINIFLLNYHDTEQNAKLDTLKSHFQGICQGGDHVYFDFDRYRQGIPQPQSRNHQPITKSMESSFHSFERMECDSARLGILCGRKRHLQCQRPSAGSGLMAGCSKVITVKGSDLSQRCKRFCRSRSMDRLDDFTFSVTQECKILGSRLSNRLSSRLRHRSWSVSDI